MPQKETWVAYGEKDAIRTEKALLRHTLNHLLQILDDEVDNCFPEELYILRRSLKDLRPAAS